MNCPAVDHSIMRIRRHLASPGVTKKALADRAGLHPNTLQGVEKESWNPTADTLRALEAQLPSPPADVPATKDGYTQTSDRASGRNDCEATPAEDEPDLPLPDPEAEAAAAAEPELPIGIAA